MLNSRCVRLRGEVAATLADIALTMLNPRAKVRAAQGGDVAAAWAEIALTNFMLWCLRIAQPQARTTC